MTTTAPTAYLEQIDPRVLHVHPRNARRDLGDLSGLSASIKAMGVVEPLVVVPVVDGHMVIAGHRRRAAAEKAGAATVPCLVRDDLMVVESIDEAEHLAAMLAENVHRQDFTAVEEAAAVQQMIDLGLPVAKVASRTGLTKGHVARAAKLAGVDTATVELVADLGLNLEQAAVVVDYADDPEASLRIAKAASDGAAAFTHAVGRAKQDKQHREQLVTMRSQLISEGRTVIDGDPQWRGPSDRTMTSLVGADGNLLTRDGHLSCPGSAVSVQMAYAGPVATEVCTDYKANGHRDGNRVTEPDDKTPEQSEADRIARSQLLENNRAMAAANTVRRTWIRDVLLARSRADKTVLRFAIEALADRPGSVGSWLSSYRGNDAAAAIAELGMTSPYDHKTDQQPTLTTGQHVPDARLPLQLLAHVAGAIEGEISKDAHRWTHGHTTQKWSGVGNGDQLARWLVFLEGEGYGLADIEQHIVNAHHEAAAGAS